MKLLLLEVKRNDWRQLERVTYCHKLAAVEPRYWQQALRFKHLRALVQYDNLELHPLNDVEACSSTGRSDNTLPQELLLPLLLTLLLNDVDTGLNLHHVLVLLCTDFTRGRDAGLNVT